MTCMTHISTTTGPHRTGRSWPGALGTLLLLAGALTACGGPSTDPGGSAQDTAKAFIATWEAGDGARMEKLITPSGLQLWALGGGSGSWLTGKTKYYGTVVKDKGQVLKLDEKDNLAQADVAVLYDCKSSDCHPALGLPAWVPAGNTLSTQHLTLEKQPDGKWLISYFTDSTYFAEQAHATEQAQVAPTQTAQTLSQQATQESYQLRAAAQATAYTVGQQATQMAYQDMLDAQKTSVAATQAAVPTATPTPVPLHVTVKTAYNAGVAAAIAQWSGDAILYEVLDHYNGNRQFGYNPNVYEYNCGGGYCNNQEPYGDGDGTSRQWLFYVASPTKKEVRVLRVLDGRLTNQDVSAALYRDTFGAAGSIPAPLDIPGYIDSDQAVKTVREHGYRVSHVENMSVYLSTSDRQQSQYTTTEPRWTVFGDDNKVVVLDPKTGEVTKNDF
ncbi:MAG: hypothetical protein M3Z04_15885 [Chloroflexota bacterium]|nr:hypothetical protein [Chloroflexota bacterium]